MPSRKNRNYGRPRDVSYIKPAKFKNYLTLNELALAVGKDRTWIMKLEAQDRIPIPQRVKMGSLSVRLWSPAQVEEIKEILSRMKPGRKPKS